MLSPPCTVFSPLQHSMTHRRRDYDAWNRQYEEGLLLFRFALSLFRKQVMAGRYGVLEHPSRATSWELPGSVFEQTCTVATCNHMPQAHTWLQGAEGGVSRARAAQEYPAAFCAAMADLVQAEQLFGPAQAQQAAAAPVAAESDVELPEVEMEDGA